jgi:hypothetical protein
MPKMIKRKRKRYSRSADREESVQPLVAKKYRKEVYDNLRDVRYVIYTNRKPEVKYLKRVICSYHFEINDYEPERGTRIMIIADD